MFATHQERLPKELAARGIDTMQHANRYLTEHYRAAFNEEFAVPAAETGSAFVPFIGSGLADALCEHHERTVRPRQLRELPGQAAPAPRPDLPLPLHQGPGAGASLPRRVPGGVPRAAPARRLRTRWVPGGRPPRRRGGPVRASGQGSLSAAGGLWICGRVLRTGASPAGRVDKTVDNAGALPTALPTLSRLSPTSSPGTTTTNPGKPDNPCATKPDSSICCQQLSVRSVRSK